MCQKVRGLFKRAGAQGEDHVFTPVIGMALCVIHNSYLCMTAAEEHYDDDDDNDLDYCNKDDDADDDDDVTPSQR